MTTPEHLEAILFDWGDTLVQFPGMPNDPETHFGCLQEFFEELSAERKRECFGRLGVPWERFLEVYRTTGAEQIAGTKQTLLEHRLEERFSRALRTLGCGCEHLPEDLEAYVRGFTWRLLNRSKPVEGASQVLMALRGQFRLGLVSNYPFAPLVVESLDRFGFLSYFETVVISGAIGWVKPHDQPFRRALEELAVQPGAALMVGDDLENDVRGAKAAGLLTAWLAPGVERAVDPAVDLHLRRLPELLEHLAQRSGAPGTE